MLEQLDSVQWSNFPQPHWNQPGDVPRALRAVASASDEATATEARHRLLFAIGNNHAGTYWPVVLPVVPFVGEIVEGGALLPRLCCLQVLIDLVGSFVPSPDHEIDEHGPLAPAVQYAVSVVWKRIEGRAHFRAVDPREKGLLGDLGALMQADGATAPGQRST
jgi:hypothetical protein